MNPSYLIGFLVVTVVIIYLLKNSKKKVTGLMSALSNVSKLIMWNNFFSYYKEKLKIDDESSGFHAAAATNYLFGEKGADMHKTLNMKEIENDAIEYIKQNQNIKELLVQSIRVIHTLNMQKNKEINLDGFEILSVFGVEFPESPRMECYFQLIDRELNKLSATVKNDIKKTFPNALNYYRNQP